ncbi:MAG: hypothetical protein K0S44_2700 [Bacteroidetes bacterium]|nr:hypothetical protein [Bacteroidota bacterium]
MIGEMKNSSSYSIIKSLIKQISNSLINYVRRKTNNFFNGERKPYVADR